MIKRIFMAGGMALVCLLLLNMGPAGGTTFSSRTGKFSINFKKTPTESTQAVETAVGDVNMYMFMYEESASKAYMVAYCDYPQEMIKDADVKGLLGGAEQGVIGKFEARVTTEAYSMFQGYQAVDFTASGPDYNTAYKLLLVGNRLYQVGILQSGPIHPSDIQDFIGSFKLSK